MPPRPAAPFSPAILPIRTAVMSAATARAIASSRWWRDAASALIEPVLRRLPEMCGEEARSSPPVAGGERVEDGEMLLAGLRDLLRRQLRKIGELMHPPQGVLPLHRL